MALHNELGKWGEKVAASYLQQEGYTIVERDWKSGHRDIDIVATDRDGTFVFVEVKTRSNRLFTDPEEAVDFRKLRNMRAAINHYIKYRGINQEVRFDIITVVGSLGSKPEVEHIKDIPLY